MRIQTKRIYESPSPSDGWRVLVDRLWPRGIKKADAAVDEWAKDLAPTDELRKWFAHDPARWDEFRLRYLHQLQANQEKVAETISRSTNATITLLFAAKDTQHNNALVLKEFLESMPRLRQSLSAPA